MKYQLAIFESPKKNEFFFHNQASIYYDFIQLSFRQFSTIGIKDSIFPPLAAYQLLVLFNQHDKSLFPPIDCINTNRKNRKFFMLPFLTTKNNQ
jgi:hypothetical protein